MTLRISFAGMTHLGINSALAASIRGVTVSCFDANLDVIRQLRNGHCDISEPGLAEALLERKDNIAFTANISELSDSNVVVIAPDIPTDDKGHSDLSHLKRLIAHLDNALSADIPLVILSQVPPGFCHQLKVNAQRILYYQVETLIFGQALTRALYPERIIVGTKDPKVPLVPDYQNYLELFSCPILPMIYQSAELTKIAINCCLVSSISVANTLAEVCENIGADWSEIVPALKLDKRIGAHAYLAPGLGISGGNLERDLNTVIELSASKGSDPKVVDAWINNSVYRKDWVLRILHSEIFPVLNGPKIAILGLAYKQDTHSVKNSPSLQLLENLKQYNVQVYDPVVSADIKEMESLSVTPCSSMLEAIFDTELLIIMTAWEEFSTLSIEQLQKTMKGQFIIDPFQMLNAQACIDAGFNYKTLGR